MSEPAKLKYTRQILEIVERELVDNQSRLRSAEVNVRRLQEERKNLLIALCDIESSLEEEPYPKDIPLIKIFEEEK